MNICGGSIPAYSQQVFIAPREDDWLFAERDWVEMPESEARRTGQDIIRCSYCDRPAAQIDGFWPWMSIGNLCADHANMEKDGWAVAGRRAHYFRGFHSLCWSWEREFYTFPGKVITKPLCARCAKRAPKKARFELVEVL